MPTIEELVARGGGVARGEARPRNTPPPPACATNDLVLRCCEAAEQFVAANKVTGLTKNSMTTYLLADSLGVPFAQPTAAARPHEAAEVEGKRILFNLKAFREELQRISKAGTKAGGNPRILSVPKFDSF